MPSLRLSTAFDFVLSLLYEHTVSAVVVQGVVTMPSVHGEQILQMRADVAVGGAN